VDLTLPLVAELSRCPSLEDIVIELTSLGHGAVYGSVSCLISDGEFSTVFTRSKCEKHCVKLQK
jgi:hypothetical protein